MVAAFRAYAYTPPDAPGPDTTPPSVPASVAANFTDPDVVVTWAASTGTPLGYGVYRNGSFLALVYVPTLTFTDPGLAPGDYTYQVRSADIAGNLSALSTPVLVTVPAPTVDATPPTVPQNVRAVFDGQRVTVTWNPSTDASGTLTYFVKRNGTVIVLRDQTQRSYVDTVASGTYSYRVGAFDASGNVSADSAAAVIVVVIAPPADVTPPSTPTGVTATYATVGGVRRVTVKWNASTDNVAVTAYGVYRNLGFLTFIQPGQFTFSENLAPGTYTYTLRAVDAASNVSGFSASATVVVPNQGYTPNVDASGATDVTEGLIAFFDSLPRGTISARTVVDFPTNATYRLAGTLEIENAISGGRHQYLTINGNGTTLKPTVTPSSTAYRTRACLRFIRSAHVIIQNLKIVGPDTTKFNDGDLEAQHGIELRGCDDFEIRNNDVRFVYGDNVYLKNGDAVTPIYCTNIDIHDNTFYGNGRQGIGIVHADGVTIHGNTIQESGRGIIDLEPGSDVYSVLNVEIYGNTIIGGRLNFIASHGAGDVSHIYAHDNVLRSITPSNPTDNTEGGIVSVDVYDTAGGRRTDWRIINNSGNRQHGQNALGGESASSGMRFENVDGLTVTGNVQPFETTRTMVFVIVVNCTAYTISGNVGVNNDGQFIVGVHH